MHTSVDLPEDPTLVLAVRINEQTYDTIYRVVTRDVKGRKLSLKTLLGNVLMVPVNNVAGWGWMDRQDFDSAYEALENWSKSRFTLCAALPKE